MKTARVLRGDRTHRVEHRRVVFLEVVRGPRDVHNGVPDQPTHHTRVRGGGRRHVARGDPDVVARPQGVVDGVDNSDEPRLRQLVGD